MESTSPRKLRIDVLVSSVIAVLLIILAVVLFYYYRNLNHDLTVLSEIGRIRNGLELSNVLATHYPIENDPVVLNSVYPGTQKLCSTGFASGLEACDDVLLNSLAHAYPDEPFTYQSTGGGADYMLEFTLLKTDSWLSLSKGAQCATRQGIRAGSCFAQ